MAKTYTEEFMAFWAAYPKRWNQDSHRYYKVGKWEAFQVWKRLNQKDRDDILAKVKYVEEGQYVLDAHRWLKKRRFDDLEIPKPKRKPVVSKVIETIESIQAKEERAARGRAWKAKYDKLKNKLFKTPSLPPKDLNDSRNANMNALMKRSK
jgi:hypothetical protein